MVDTKILKGLARETAELALLLAALPSEGLRGDLQPLSDIEYMALRILKEASSARNGNVHAVGESSGVWRAVQPGLLSR